MHLSPGMRPFVEENYKGILHPSIHSFYLQSSYCYDTVIKVMELNIKKSCMSYKCRY